MTTPASTVALSGAMVHNHQVLMGILQEHLDDQEGEVLPHLLMADVARWAERQWTVDRQLVVELLDWLESEYRRAQGEVADLIAVSFIEHIVTPDDRASGEICRALGVSMKAHADLLSAGPRE